MATVSTYLAYNTVSIKDNKRRYIPTFSLCNFSDTVVQMQIRHSRQKYHKSAHKIIIYGPIKKIKALQKAWNVCDLIEAQTIHHLVIQNCDISISQILITALHLFHCENTTMQRYKSHLSAKNLTIDSSFYTLVTFNSVIPVCANRLKIILNNFTLVHGELKWNMLSRYKHVKCLSPLQLYVCNKLMNEMLCYVHVP